MTEPMQRPAAAHLRHDVGRLVGTLVEDSGPEGVVHPEPAVDAGHRGVRLAGEGLGGDREHARGPEEHEVQGRICSA